MRNDTVDTVSLEDGLLELVAEEAMVDRELMSREAKLEDLDIASADFVMILMAIEEKHGVYISIDNEMAELKTVQDLLNLATKAIAEAQD